ncbi:hypothetical protein BCR35DRAFT_301125 [Leucosporidium creatinivorum]|uniref:G-patch domain-containing protein n=1 Tax=Leucosporidium creatinivorum TaxID=106004 RepID=A0A1Y2FXJ8_9BASI|nr:hypothetical protein BCR35DRAFT_301125 [Leucosporidium creatinivorum]
MSLYAGINLGGKQPNQPTESTPAASASPTASASASPAPVEPSAADKSKPAWSAALRFAPVPRKKPAKPPSSSIPSAFTAAFAADDGAATPPPIQAPRIVGRAKPALSATPAAIPRGRWGSASSTADPVPVATTSSASPVPTSAASPAPPAQAQPIRIGRTLARPPPMTLDDEEDVNGFKQTSAGKRAEKRKAHAVGNGKGKGRKREDPALAFGDTPYEPSRPCDYSAYKAHVQAVRTQRRLDREEQRRREKSSSYESDSEDDRRDDQEQSNKKPRFFAPPSSYDDPPQASSAAPPAFTPAPPPPPPAEYTSADRGDRSQAPREETGEEAYLRRLAMSSKPAAPAPPPLQQQQRPAYPSFAPATHSKPPSFVSSSSSASTGPSSTYPPPPPPAFAGPSQHSYPPPPPPPGFIPPTFFAPPGVGADDFPPFQPPPPPPPAASEGGGAAPNQAIADAQAKAREIAQRLSKLQGFQPPQAPTQEAATPTPPPQAPSNEEPDNRPFADRMMSKFGWEAGKGLGASESGMTTALSVSRTPSAATSKRAAAKAKAKGEELPPPEPKGMAGSRAKVVDSTREKRLEAEREARGGDPSRVVLLTNLCGVEDVDDDLGGEVAEEANKFGVVERCFVYLVPGETRDDEAVRIFLVMSGLAGGYNAVRQFEGRFFGGRVVKARFYNEAAFNAGHHQL